MAEPVRTVRKDGTVSESHGKGHGGPARGYSWEQFKAGNIDALDHGGYATVSLRKRIAQIADEVRLLVPNYAISDEPAVQALARYEARIERCVLALEWVYEHTAENPVSQFVGKPADEFERVAAALDRAEATSRRMRLDLGLTPEARWKLGLTAANAVEAAQRIDLDRLPIEQRVALFEALDAATVEDAA